MIQNTGYRIIKEEKNSNQDIKIFNDWNKINKYLIENYFSINNNRI